MGSAGATGDQIMNIKSQCYDHNLIADAGFCGPFVAILDGRIYVGDSDNLESFDSPAAAREWCTRARLDGQALDRARQAHEQDQRDGDAAEYMWHMDAGLQLDVLVNL